MPVQRKSVASTTAVTTPSRVSAERQSRLHFVGQSPWSDKASLAEVRELILPAIKERQGSLEAWIVHDAFRAGSTALGLLDALGVKLLHNGRLGWSLCSLNQMRLRARDFAPGARDDDRAA